MSFFNKKEEVIDIKLTQFGKDLLARGAFKPVYYQFFDDDILYNSEAAGFSELQNDSESRILENTPKLKTRALALGVETSFTLEKEKSDENRKVFKPIDRNADPYVQDRILLYPLGSCEVSNQSAPSFKLRAHANQMEEGVSYLHLTASGIRKNIPQISVSASFSLAEDRSEILDQPGFVNAESFIDISSREITFADNSKINLYGQPLIIDLEELNTVYGIENFELEIYEVTERSSGKVLTKLEDLNMINKLFHIKTDSDVEEVEVKTGRKGNYYRSNES